MREGVPCEFRVVRIEVASFYVVRPGVGGDARVDGVEHGEVEVGADDGGDGLQVRVGLGVGGGELGEELGSESAAAACIVEEDGVGWWVREERCLAEES